MKRQSLPDNLEDLGKLLKDLKTDLNQFYIDVKTKVLNDVSKIRKTKRQIARVITKLTLLRRKA